ncbi:MAG: HIT family protein [Candidatus Pacebacteria bacterium]|nr:HIT family protein [Candidatus Paceibacterota bacterium]
MTHSTNTDQENCIFCKIVAGEIAASKVYEDDETIAFLDIQPVNPGHTLVIPKDHFENIYTTPVMTWMRVQMTAQKVALAVKHATDADGVNIYMNNEAAAGQVVPHTHVHIIPRYNDDNLTLWHGTAYKDPEEMESFADKISTELKTEN